MKNYAKHPLYEDIKQEARIALHHALAENKPYATRKAVIGVIVHFLRSTMPASFSKRELAELRLVRKTASRLSGSQDVARRVSQATGISQTEVEQYLNLRQTVFREG
ncbi:hypothetical protein AUJ65_05080 [Candidatus Micrarchaeota archaeon CG1_02_51_15]|nr:MAG: hypothetical protein AUJ65_05080 [Candidatus Micrarchaeota archaeon CG1_02_51_15]